jgi:hypothetical protein
MGMGHCLDISVGAQAGTEDPSDSNSACTLTSPQLNNVLWGMHATCTCRMVHRRWRSRLVW